MMTSLKKIAKNAISSAFEIVYILTFTNQKDVPNMTEEIKRLGKWYVNTGDEWICHSNLPLSEFQEKFLELIHLTSEQVFLTKDHLPFSK